MKIILLISLLFSGCALFPNTHWEFQNQEDIRCSQQCHKMKNECAVVYEETMGTHREQLTAHTKCLDDADHCFRFCGGVEIQDS